MDEAEAVLNEKFGDKVAVFRAGPRVIDVQAKGVSKAAAARRLQQQMGRKILVCMGDAENDVVMLNEADFAFVYLGFLDDAGHRYGWMSEEYMDAMRNSWNNINRLVEALPEDYAVIITADHGGHDRMHGTDLPEDMTIPMLFYYKGEGHAVDLSDASIKDIAPTITALLGVGPDEEWEGKSLLC